MKTCNIEGCANLTKINRKICETHRQRFLRYGSYELSQKPELPIGIIKICKIHGDLTADIVKIRCSNGSEVKIQYSCKLCGTAKRQKYRKNNKEKISEYKKKDYRKNAAERRLITLLRNHMLTKDEYFYMQETQQNKCAICNKPEKRKHQNGSIRSLAVDHCEITGKTRSLLCADCNTAIGLLFHNPEIIYNAAEYICSWRDRHGQH